MYAIAFDMDTEQLKQLYPQPQSWNNAYQDIGKILREEKFARQQGSVYFPEEGIPNGMVHCVLAAQRLAKDLPWFAACVRDMRMLRIEEQNDLMPAISAI